MGLFKKKKNNSKKSTSAYGEGNLPRLPSLPELPSSDSKNDSQNKINNSNNLSQEETSSNQLPIFPRSFSGDSFSQGSIKNAVSGESDDDSMQEGMEEMVSSRGQNVAPSKTMNDNPFRQSAGSKNSNALNEPVFIRFDKFEEGSEIFGEIKDKVEEIQKNLEDIKEIKEDEEKELKAWEDEVQGIKNQIEKVENDLFSKVE